MSIALHPFETIATLSDEHHLTCSFDAAKKLVPESNIVSCASFEEAVAFLKDNKVQSVLVPAAYVAVRNFIMDRELQCTSATIEPLCPIVLAGLGPERPNRAKIVFLQQALESLLKDVEVSIDVTKFVLANPTAAKLALATGLEALAVTNEFSARFYGLVIYEILRDAIRMPWLLFRRAELTSMKTRQQMY